MKSIHVLEAINNIDDRYIVASWNRLGGVVKEHGKTKGKVNIVRLFRKAVILVAAVVLLMSATIATAMTVSEDFREMVFRFLRIEQTEMVPEPVIDTVIDTESMYVEPQRINIGGVIEGTYVHTPTASYAVNGVYLICTDEMETKQGSSYDAYREENGVLIKLEENTFSHNYTILGNEFHVEFDWVEHNGTVIQTFVGPDAAYVKPNLSGRAEAALFRLYCTRMTAEGTREETEYPVLLNLTTGELTDVLAGTGAEELLQIANAAISDDLSRMLLVQSDGTLYYVDLVEKELYSVDELSGEHAEACSLIGDTLSCWAREEGYKAWAIDLATFERREVFEGIPDAASTEESDAGIQFIVGFDTWIRDGNMYAGSSFALEVDEERNVFVIDLMSGEKAQIEGFVWPDKTYPDIWRIPSPDGKKLLLCGGRAGFNYQYMGVLDFERKTFVEFSRENNTDAQEHSAYWFGEDSVIIRTSATELSHDYYVYRMAEVVAKEPEDYEFVRVKDYVPDVVVELCYASENNFTGQQIYDFTDAWLRYGTVKKLMQVQEELEESGLYLKVWDAFRPVWAQYKLWEVCPDSTYVSDPNNGFSSHSRGNTVDITLVKADGTEVVMPTDYDDFSQLADRDYSDCEPAAAANAQLLEAVMMKYGFKPYYGEWWHYSDDQEYMVDEVFQP